MNSTTHYTTKKRKTVFSGDPVRKVIYLAILNAMNKQKMPIQNWQLVMNWFAIHFE